MSWKSLDLKPEGVVEEGVGGSFSWQPRKKS
jgi:hypothetical protein